LVAAGDTVPNLLAAGFSITELAVAGADVSDLLEEGATVAELFDAGIGVGTLEQNSVDPDSLIAAGLIGTVSDIDGNNYKWIKIDTLIWMAENLKTSKLFDGTAIPLVTDSIEWNNLTTPGYCWYSNNNLYEDTYGGLYNWYTVETDSLCPDGWHIPSDTVWTNLLAYLGGEHIAGGKLKEADTLNWFNPNIGATNETGFTALPGGNRYHNDTTMVFDKLGYEGAWWSTTEYSVIKAWWIYMDYLSTEAKRVNYGFKERGYSVRCIKD
jgi:uncharacterized protein (TIGR02145 family)